MRYRHAAACSWALLGLVAGCGDDTTGEPAGLVHTLDDGTKVEVEPSGAISLSRDGRALIGIDARGPEAASFTLGYRDLFGQWQFSRVDERRDRFVGYRGSDVTPDGVVVRYRTVAGREARITIGLDGGALFVTVDADEAYDALALPLRCDERSSFYGFGEQYNATDQRGERFDLFVEEQGIGRTGSPDALSLSGHAHTTYYPMPYFVDARGFGVLLETDYRTLVDLCPADDPTVAWFEVESKAPLRARVLPGPTPRDVVEQLGDVVGRPTAPPPWAYALWIGAQGGRDAVLAEVAALEAAEVPVGVLWVQDWTGPRPNLGEGTGVQYRWVADEAHYPELSAMVADLHQRGYRFLAYANPFVMPELDHFDEMSAEHLLIEDAEGNVRLHASPAGDASHPDLTNPAARAYVEARLSDMVRDLGFDGWMADFGEWLPVDAVLRDGSDALAAHNRYPEAWHRLSREVMEAERPNGDWVVFTRSGFTGQQSVAQLVWCGDQEATFERGDGLPTVVPCMLNLGLSGVPFVTHDIAGFSGGPSTKELYLRWIELGAFTPVMRTHEGNLRDENWSWDRDVETTAHLRRFARIHDALGPELAALAEEAAATSMPIVRHLMLEFPDDEGSRAVDDEFLLGPDLLVAPVVDEGAETRVVHFPPGSWFDVWSGERYEGPSRAEVPAPIGSPPVFARGSDRTDLRTIQ
jgi:alpha-glucosidase